MVRSFAGVSVALAVAILPSAMRAQTVAPIPGVEYVSPTPGCPGVPTIASARKYCEQADPRDNCKASEICRQASDTKRCFPRQGKYFDKPSGPPMNIYTVLAPPSAIHLQFWAGPDGTINRLDEDVFKLFRSRQWDKAIAEYTKAIKDGYPFDGVTHWHAMRAFTHEKKGDKTNALADYCQALTFAAHWQSEILARERVAQLTKAEAPKPAPQFIASGLMRIARGRVPDQAILFSVITPQGFDYLIKVVDAATDKEAMLIYAKAGTKTSVAVPRGSFKVRGTFGHIWYGMPTMFGDGAQFFRVQENDADHIFKFERAAENEYVLLLFPTGKGNLKTPPISPADFAK